MRTHPALLAACLACTSFAAAAGTLRNELVLAGGSLRLCSSMATRDCRDPTRFAALPATRTTRAARIDDETLAAALDPVLWRVPAQRDALVPVLAALRARTGGAPMDEDAMVLLLEATCTQDGRIAPCGRRVTAPFARLDDHARAAVLSALEVAPAAGVQRDVERASLGGGTSPHGADVLRAFVAAAARRAPGRTPRIAVVTASALDPFDPVDAYLDLLRQAGAQVQWWPLDAALARAVETGRCAQLEHVRMRELRIARRARVYPDLAASQQAACADPAALAAVPDAVDGVFFSGGDQWRLRRAFFDARDVPHPWLPRLRAAVERGDVVIGGTSAGSAVQSGAAMLGNGAARAHRRVFDAAPPDPGCTRAGTCPRGIDEDALTVWRAGGLGLAPGMIVDTHFSERGRTTRLLQALAATGATRGVGIDETSALHLAWQPDGSVLARAIGAQGGWLFDRVRPCTAGVIAADAHYLAPGARAWIGPSVRVEVDAGVASPVPPSQDPAAARNAARRLAVRAEAASAREPGARLRFGRGSGFAAWGRPAGVAGLAIHLRAPCPTPP